MNTEDVEWGNNGFKDVNKQQNGLSVHMSATLLLEATLDAYKAQGIVTKGFLAVVPIFEASGISSCITRATM